jgi:hypothetical protein
VDNFCHPPSATSTVRPVHSQARVARLCSIFLGYLMQAMMLEYWVHLDNVLCESQQQAAFADPFVHADTNIEPSQQIANAHLLASKCYVTTVQHVNDQNCKHTYRRQSTSHCTLQFSFLPYPDLVGVFISKMFVVLEYKKNVLHHKVFSKLTSPMLCARDMMFASEAIIQVTGSADELV